MILSPDAAGQIDGSVQKHILNYLPELPVDIVPISWFPNFVFVEPPTKNYILIDFMEPHSDNTEYDKFFNWVKGNQPKLWFQRELRKRPADTFKPIEFPAYLPIPAIQAKDEFDKRPIEVLFFWGMSSINRPKLHGDIFREGMAKHGINVIDQWNESWIKEGRNWATIYAPWWNRKPMVEIIPWMSKAKITVSIRGNGKKNFRDSECLGTIMALHAQNLSWSYDWNDSNSIQLTPEMEFYELEQHTHRNDLYELYVRSCENMANYHISNYTSKYVIPEILKVI